MLEEEDSANEMGRSGEGEATSLSPTEIEPIVGSAPNIVAFFVRFKHFSDMRQNSVRSKSYDDSKGRIWGLTVGFGAEGSPADELCCSVYCISERRTTITAAVTCLTNSQSTYGSRRLTLSKDEVLFGRSPSPEYGQRTGRLRISRSTVLSEFCSNDVLTLKVVIEVDELRHLVIATSDSVEDDEPPAKKRRQVLRYDRTTADLTIKVPKPEAIVVEECLELFDTIPVHREVLCAASDVFQAMFTVDTVGSNTITNTITISDYPIHVVKSMVSFLYNGKCDPAVLETDAEALLSIASVYGVTSLTAYVERFFLSRLNFDNISFILHLCQTYEECQELRHRLLEFVSDHRESVLRSETFRKSLSTDMLQKIVNTLCNITETEIKDTPSRALDAGNVVEVYQQERYQDRDSRAEGDVVNVRSTDFVSSDAVAAAASPADASVCYPAPTQPPVSTGYVFTTNEALKQAVDLWCDPTTAARAHTWYGHISTWDTSQITSMKELFKDKTDFNDDISSWDVSKVKSMECMFYDAKAFNQPIGAWNVSKVTIMDNMFCNAKAFNQPMGMWDVSNVTSMGYMFFIAKSFNQPIGSWNVSNVTIMNSTFCGAEAFNQPIGMWNVSSLANMDIMFCGAYTFNQPIGSWNVSNVTSMDYMFYDAHAFNQPISSWNVSNVTSMRHMFRSAQAFNQPIGTWNVSNVTNLEFMFSGTKTFNQPIGSWNVSMVTNMEHMFYDAKAFNQSIGTWDVLHLTCMYGMFSGAEVFNQPIGLWDVSRVTNMQAMLCNAKAFNQPIGTWDVSNVTNMANMFYNTKAFNQPIGAWDVSNVTSMQGMFYSAEAFNQPIGAWDVSNVTSMPYMFCNANDFNHPIGSWDVSNVTNMHSMFSGTRSFNKPIGTWDTSKITRMDYMFLSVQSLTDL